jgi:hypothetical protein
MKRISLPLGAALSVASLTALAGCNQTRPTRATRLSTTLTPVMIGSTQPTMTPASYQPTVQVIPQVDRFQVLDTGN